MNEQFDVAAVDCCVVNVQARLIDRLVKILNFLLFDPNSTKNIVTLSTNKKGEVVIASC